MKPSITHSIFDPVHIFGICESGKPADLAHSVMYMYVHVETRSSTEIVLVTSKEKKKGQVSRHP